MLLALHPWHHKARLRVKQRSPQESQPAQHRVHLASGAAALGWPHQKDERRMHPKSSLPQMESVIMVFQKSVQRSAEETACTVGKQPSVMAAGGLRLRQLALISEESQL